MLTWDDDPTPTRTCSCEEHDRRMIDAAARIFDALKRLRPGQRYIVDREPGGRIRCADWDMQAALREIDELAPEEES